MVLFLMCNIFGASSNLSTNTFNLKCNRECVLHNPSWVMKMHRSVNYVHLLPSAGSDRESETSETHDKY